MNIQERQLITSLEKRVFELETAVARLLTRLDGEAPHIPAARHPDIQSAKPTLVQSVRAALGRK